MTTELAHDPGAAEVGESFPDEHETDHETSFLGMVDRFPEHPTVTVTYCADCVAYSVTLRWD